MENEKLFRGKRTDYMGWVSGRLIEDEFGNKEIIFIKNKKLKKTAVHPETIDEYTGYKDCMGKDIFVNDIIHDMYYVGRGKRNYYYKVESKDGIYGMSRISDDSFTSFEHLLFTSETIIGNVHDKPELLKPYKKSRI